MPRSRCRAVKASERVDPRLATEQARISAITQALTARLRPCPRQMAPYRHPELREKLDPEGSARYRRGRGGQADDKPEQPTNTYRW